MKDITLLTVNFNQNKMTAFMLKSFIKNMGNNINYLIIDNSTIIEKSLINSGLNVFNNLNNHITGNYHQCSKNHCSTIDYALKNLIKTKYVLLCDNDIFFKPSIISLLKNYKTNDCIGEIGWDDAPPERLFPYFCIINVEKFRNEKLNYFDNKRCIGPGSKEIGHRGPGTVCWYKDTGCSFLEDIKNTWNIKLIKLYPIPLQSSFRYHPK